MVMKEIRNEEDENTKFAQFIKVGDKTEGKLAEVKDSEKYGKVYALENNGENIVVVGKTDLNQKMSKVAIGNYVSIELKEIVKTANKNTLKIFKVMVDDGQPQEETIN